MTTIVPTAGPQVGPDDGPEHAMARFRHASGLAAVLSRPFSTLDQASLRLAGLSAGETSRLAAHPSFRHPLERAVLAERGLAASALVQETLRPEIAGADRRLAMAFLSEPIARLREAGLLLAAATLQRPLLQLAHKVDRRRIRDILGEEVHRVATQEAPTLHPALAMPAARPVLDGAMDTALPVEAAREGIVDFGLALVARFVAIAAPDLREIMRHRLPESARAPGTAAFAEAMEPQQARHVMRFLRRRVPEWSAITG